MACEPREDSHHPRHLPSLTRVFAVHSLGSEGPKLSSCGQQRLWSDRADAQADLSLCWAHMPFCRFCHTLAQMSSAAVIVTALRLLITLHITCK